MNAERVEVLAVIKEAAEDVVTGDVGLRLLRAAEAVAELVAADREYDAAMARRVTATNAIVSGDRSDDAFRRQATTDHAFDRAVARRTAALAAITALLPSAADEPVLYQFRALSGDWMKCSRAEFDARQLDHNPPDDRIEWRALYDRPASARPSAGVEDIAEIVRGIDASESVNPTPNPECSAQVKLVDVSDWQAIKAALSSVAPAAMLNPPLPPHLRGLAGDGVVTTARFAGEGGCYGDGCPGCSVCNSTGSDLDQDSPA